MGRTRPRLSQNKASTHSASATGKDTPRRESSGGMEWQGVWNCIFELLTNFCAPFFKEIPFFFCGVTPSKTLAAPEPLNIAFPLGNGEVLRSEEWGGDSGRKGTVGRGKKRKKGCAKSAQALELLRFQIDGFQIASALGIYPKHLLRLFFALRLF